MPRVIYAPAADDDLVDIAAYLARDKPEAARRWVRTIHEKCELLAFHPAMGEARHGFGVPACRSFSVGNYVVFFRAIDDGIEVARIVHGSRDIGSFLETRPSTAARTSRTFRRIGTQIHFSVAGGISSRPSRTARQ